LLLAAIVALASIVGIAPVSVSAASSPPKCRYDDILTRYTSYSDWDKTLVDTIFMVNRGYKPPKMVSVSRANIAGAGSVRNIVIPDLRAMAAAARKAKAPLKVVSAYRSFGTQASVYNREVKRVGVKRARLGVARPGHSEHQLGTTLDFTSAGGKKAWAYSDWGQTAAGKWIRQNGWKYGFVLSYPKNKRSAVCYQYEPWHWRWVGRDLAAKIQKSGLTVRHYLWSAFH
jgi:D-alanyl-D-alanine carboxypeptidase